jgi:hypothetical protein
MHLARVPKALVDGVLCRSGSILDSLAFCLRLILDCLRDSLLLEGIVVHCDTSDLGSADNHQTEVDCCKAVQKMLAPYL